ncbi:MAG: MBL fold metallo-hydrolase [Chloroflexota bacterium]|nr:MBL fold metallo-hydrolase [Chloroflexota bacterium]
MKQVELAPGIFHLQSGSNMGLVVRDGRGLLIDTGLDKDSARRAQRMAEGMDVTLEAIFITHAHADHFGGAHFLQRRTEAELYAPALEAAMMENPIIEPLYLFSGASPVGELLHKFTLAKACRVDHVVEPGALEIGPFQIEVVSLPGHAPNQVGVAVKDVLFCGDAVFPTEALEKHKIPFFFDLDEGLATLERLPGLPYAHFAPGHGPAYTSGDEIAQICAANRERLEEIRSLVYAALKEPQEASILIQQVTDHFGLQIEVMTIYLLVRTTIFAALCSLERAGKVMAEVQGNRLLWRRGGEMRQKGN